MAPWIRCCSWKTRAALSEQSQTKGIAFLFAVCMGATMTFFSDFGPKHLITDEGGEPTQSRCMSNVEIIEVSSIVKVNGAKDGDRLLVITLASDHSSQAGGSFSVDGMHGDLKPYEGKRLKVKRFGVLSP